VRVIVPFAPAGTTDISARLIGQWLSERLGQQFVIENRAGANGNIGTEVVLRSTPLHAVDDRCIAFDQCDSLATVARSPFILVM
jgi:tripartite-type tricarboxylate transporter receptor subunit TctC